MKVRNLLATGAFALALASPALANQTTHKPAHVWVHFQAVPSNTVGGQPAIVYGIASFETLPQCKADMKGMPAQDVKHWDNCALWNEYQPYQAGDGTQY